MVFLTRNSEVLSQEHEDKLILRLINGEIVTLNSTAKCIFELCNNTTIDDIYEKYKK